MSEKKQILSRELSWLSFNERVLQEAADNTVPLIERMRFLGIFSNNLDEFFKVRVASIKRMVDFKSKSADYEHPDKVLVQIQEKVIELQSRFWRIFMEIIKELEKENIYVIDEEELNKEQAEYVDQYFDDHILPYLSPILLSNVKEFPALKDKTIYFAIKLTDSKDSTRKEFALVEIPCPPVKRIITLPAENNKKYIILLDDVIRFCLKDLFASSNYDTFVAHTIKITRDAELDIDNDLSKSFLEKISESVNARTKGQPVRFVYDENIPKDILSYILKKMGLTKHDNIIPGSRYHNFKDFISFPNIGAKHLEYPPTPALDHYKLKRHGNIFKEIMVRDICLHYPYQKFAHFIDFLREAAIDPNVESVKITMYRIAKESRVVNALINAARNGKKVTVVIELQARFDEESNIYWAKKLEEENVNILFGIKGLKIHAKLVHVSMKKGNPQHFSAVATGNFHEGNAAVYTDFTLLTCDKRITTEVNKLFEFFENTYKNYNFKHLLVAPLYMRNRVYKIIDNEIKNAQSGIEAYMIIKINNLVDKEMIEYLYDAGKSGVKIKLIVRGICCLKAGVPGLSENIEAVSIVDKYLEHSRIFIFCNGGNELYYISSADWMTRNLDHRIEVACPIYDESIQKLIKKNLGFHLNDNTKARIYDEKLSNQYRKNDDQPVRAQMAIYEHYRCKYMQSVLNDSEKCKPKE